MKNLQKNKYRILFVLSKYSFVVILLFTLLLPTVIVRAADPNAPVPYGGGTSTSQTYGGGTSTPKTTQIGGTGIENPLPGINDIPSFIVTVINAILHVGVPIITLAIIYSGFLFVSAQGNPEKIGKAKEALVYTVVGAAILLGSFIIANAIKGTVDVIKTENQ